MNRRDGPVHQDGLARAVARAQLDDRAGQAQGSDAVCCSRVVCTVKLGLLPAICSMKNSQTINQHTACPDARFGSIMGQKVRSLSSGLRPRRSTLCIMGSQVFLGHLRSLGSLGHLLVLQVIVLTTGIGSLAVLTCVQDILTQCGPLIKDVFYTGDAKLTCSRDLCLLCRDAAVVRPPCHLMTTSPCNANIGDGVQAHPAGRLRWVAS